MFSQRVKNLMDPQALLCAAPDTRVVQAARLMANHQTSAVLVVEQGVLKGIFTAGDAVCRVLARGLDPQTTPLSAVMTAPVQTAAPDWSLGRALQVMHQHHLRQMPVVEDDRPIGLLTARDALDPELEEFACEVQRRQAYTLDPPPRSTPRAV